MCAGRRRASIFWQFELRAAWVRPVEHSNIADARDHDSAGPFHEGFYGRIALCPVWRQHLELDEFVMGEGRFQFSKKCVGYTGVTQVRDWRKRVRESSQVLLLLLGKRFGGGCHGPRV